MRHSLTLRFEMNADNRVVDYERNATYTAASTAQAYRGRYPSAPLRIFKTSSWGHIFFVEDEFYTSDEKIKEFGYSIRPVASGILLSGKLPESGEELNVADLLAFQNEMEVVHTLESLENALALRHPELSILGLSQDGETLALKIMLPEASRGLDLSELYLDIDALAWKKGGVEIVFRDDNIRPQPSRDDVFSIIRSSVRDREVQALAHVREDEERWYTEFDRAAKGEIGPEDFSFGLPGGSRTVFLPVAEAKGLPDLRNYFLLYDNVLMEVPLAEDFTKLRGGLREDDYAEAAARGRLHLLVTQPEERLPLRLLQAVQERSRTAIIGRRASTAFAMATLSDRMKQFREHVPDVDLLTSVGAKSLEKVFGVERGTAERVLAAPIADYYDALGALRHKDLKALPYRRGEDALAFARAILRGHDLPDLRLEFHAASNMVGIGNLFGAEVALGQVRSPFAFPAHLTSTLFALFGNELPVETPLVGDEKPQHDHSVIRVYPEGPLFEFSETRPLAELLDVVDSKSAAVAGSIFSDLARLPEEEREARIRAINDIVHAFGALPSERIIGKGMAARHANLIVQGLGLIIPLVGSIVGSMQLLDGVLAFFRDTERLKTLGEDVARSRRQVELLRQIRKVAWLDERRSASR
jgi:hypothetical protein